MLTASEVVRRLGGRASYGQVVAYTSRPALRRAVAAGDVRRLRRGVYALPELPPAHAAAAAAGGVLSHTTAARMIGLEIGLGDDAVHVTVPRGGRVRRCGSVVVHWKALASTDLAGHITGPLRTVLDCATLLPFPQALAVADSALQLKFVHPHELAAAARARRGPGRAACMRVAAWADREAHNAFESVLRGTLIDSGITDLVPQLAVELPRFMAHVDLGDAARKIAIEADSFTYHATRDAFSRDCERYNELVAAGWLVLRFTWEQVMFRPEWVADTVRQTRVGRRPRRSA